ncbi:MAG: hypothetical protein ABEI32_01890 [Halothece sp.]|jgi:hypothetical protein
MPQPFQVESLRFETTAIYRIVVQGFIDQADVENVGGMYISYLVQGQTILVGEVRDQSALNGILNTLLELHLPIVLVECLG